jgi:hypothetical protein
MNPLFGLVCGLAAALPLVASAGPVADKAAEIEGMQAAGDAEGAMNGARDLLAEVWTASEGLIIAEALLIAEPAVGYGIYNPRPDNKLKLGAPFLIYVEPVGLAFAEPGDGLFASGFYVDLKVINAAGDVLGELQNLTEQNQVSRHKIHEYQANLTLTIGGIPPGPYVLQTTLRDKNSAKIGSFETAVEFVE